MKDVFIQRYKEAVNNYFIYNGDSEGKIIRRYIFEEYERILKEVFNVDETEIKRIYHELYYGMYNGESLSICIYADQTSLFTEYEICKDNLTDMLFPTWVVKEWYDKNGFVEHVAKELKRPVSECTFNDWLYEVYTAEETDGLYSYALSRGYTPMFGIDGDAYVYSTDEHNFQYIVFNGTYDECRQFGKEHDWRWINDEDLAIGVAS